MNEECPTRPRYADPHMQEAVVNLEEVREFLATRGYRPEKLEQHWRHLTGSIIGPGNERKFLKLASTLAIGERTENEVRWYHKVGQFLREQSGGLVFCPAIYETGSLSGCFFYIGEFVHGNVIPPLNYTGANEDEVRLLVPALAEIAAVVAKFSHREMWELFPMRTDSDLLRHLYRRSAEWITCAREREAPEAMIELALSLKDNFRAALNHGDYSIGNVLCLSPRSFALVDGEHSFSGWPMWYDFANMVHRLGTRGSTELADIFMRSVRSFLPREALATFEREVAPVVAYCSLRGFYELQIDKLEQPALGKHREFARFVVDYFASNI